MDSHAQHALGVANARPPAVCACVSARARLHLFAKANFHARWQGRDSEIGETARVREGGRERESGDESGREGMGRGRRDSMGRERELGTLSEHRDDREKETHRGKHLPSRALAGLGSVPVAHGDTPTCAAAAAPPSLLSPSKRGRAPRSSAAASRSAWRLGSVTRSRCCAPAAALAAAVTPRPRGAPPDSDCRAGGAQRP